MEELQIIQKIKVNPEEAMTKPKKRPTQRKKAKAKKHKKIKPKHPKGGEDQQEEVPYKWNPRNRYGPKKKFVDKEDVVESMEKSRELKIPSWAKFETHRDVKGRGIDPLDHDPTSLYVPAAAKRDMGAAMVQY